MLPRHQAAHQGRIERVGVGLQCHASHLHPHHLAHGTTTQPEVRRARAHHRLHHAQPLVQGVPHVGREGI
ncbi:hypothetical protein ACLEPN_34975 [Myxococcus sp. 1LA]